MTHVNARQNHILFGKTAESKLAKHGHGPRKSSRSNLTISFPMKQQFGKQLNDKR